MSVARKILLSAFVFLISANAVFALDLSVFKGFVNDYAGVLRTEDKAYLEDFLLNFEKQTHAEIAVAIVQDLQGTTVEDFAEKLFQEWELGKAKQDNGVLFLISIGDRKARFEIGYGLEGDITDGDAGYILDHSVIPYFKNEDYAGGVRQGVFAIADSIRLGPDAVKNSDKENGNVLFNIFAVLFPFIPFVFSYIASFLGRSRRIWPGGAIGLAGGGIVGFFIGAWITAVIFGLLFGLVGLFLDFIVSKNYAERKRRGLPTDFWHSGGGFWFGGGRGGFGSGFGGFGGGGSGGGGASRGW